MIHLIYHLLRSRTLRRPILEQQGLVSLQPAIVINPDSLVPSHGSVKGDCVIELDATRREGSVLPLGLKGLLEVRFFEHKCDWMRRGLILLCRIR